MWSASGGVAYTLNRDGDHPTLFSIDALMQSGLRTTADNGAPNGISLQSYAVANVSVVQKVNLGAGRGTEVRRDVLNLMDSVHQIRNGSVVGAPQYGLRRTILAALTQRFGAPGGKIAGNASLP